MRFYWLHAYKLPRSDWNTEWSAGQFIIQAPVVQTLDTAIHGIKIYLVDNAIGFPSTYLLDSDLSAG